MSCVPYNHMSLIIRAAYHSCGCSIGGVLASEAVLQLRGVSSLSLIDPPRSKALKRQSDGKGRVLHGSKMAQQINEPATLVHHGTQNGLDPPSNVI